MEMIETISPPASSVTPKPDASTRPEPGRCAWTVPLILDRLRRLASPQPMTIGIPFPRGMLTDPRTLALEDARGVEVGLQTDALARWTDGSVKWLLLDFVLGSVEGVAGRWTLRPSDAPAHRRPSPSIQVRELPQTIEIDTGAAIFHIDLDRADPSAIAQILIGGQGLLNAPFRTLLTDAKGGLGRPRVERIVVEVRGPIRAVVRLEGSFGGRVPCRFLSRLSFFAGTGLVRLGLTLHNPRRARHPGGLWDLGDSGSMLFRDLTLELGLDGSGASRIDWSAEVGGPTDSTEAGPLEIYQGSSGGPNWKSKNHVNRHGRVPTSFRGYRVRCTGREWSGLRASPRVSIYHDDVVVSAAIPDFWQQFPKAIEASDRQLRLRLFPGQFGDLFELQGGEQKTHTLWLHFGPQDQQSSAPLDWVHQPAGAHAPADWYASSGAIPRLPASSSGSDGRLESLLSGVVDGQDSFTSRREIIDEYGWRNYGDIYADHEQAYYEGPRPAVSHFNNQYDVIYGASLQYFRTGDARWLEILNPLVRHVIDIDIYHTKQDRAAYNGGLFWFTDHYKDAGTCTHRTYSRSNCLRGDRSYGGGPSSNHNFTTGLLHVYFLTGDPDARDAVIGLADWVLNMDDGRKNLLGLLDDGPTGLASQTGDPNYHGPGRGCGNSVNALLDAWLVTGRRLYLGRAEDLIRRSVHPADEVDGRDLLNVEKRWSYTVFLAVLSRYLDVKAEAGELDFMYAYARASLITYARWMLDNEVPYFDRPAKLEYPTETWAAQEFRKANVLRLAAAHADEPLRSDLLRRGDELAERGWDDLSRFESRSSARAIALMMIEGPLDSYFRKDRTDPAALPIGTYDFGRPGTFVPQKARVLARLRGARGLARTLIGLADLRRWRALISWPPS